MTSANQHCVFSQSSLYYVRLANQHSACSPIANQHSNIAFDQDEILAKEEEIRQQETEERQQRIEAFKEKRRLEKLVSVFCILRAFG